MVTCGLVIGGETFNHHLLRLTPGLLLERDAVLLEIPLFSLNNAIP